MDIPTFFQYDDGETMTDNMPSKVETKASTCYAIPTNTLSPRWHEGHRTSN